MFETVDERGKKSFAFNVIHIGRKTEQFLFPSQRASAIWWRRHGGKGANMSDYLVVNNEK